MIRMLMLLGVSVVPMVVTASIIDGQNKVAQGFDEPTARRSQNVEIAPSPQYAIAPPSPTARGPDPVEPEPEFQLAINTCGSQAGNANLRVGDDVIGIISAGTVVDLTGNVSGEWIEVSGAHWPIGANHPINGAGWIHECWR